MVDRLARDGLVERRPCEVDRRRVYVHLTRRGRALEQRVSPLLDEVYAGVEKLLDAAEWRALYTALDRLREKGLVSSYESAPTPERGGRRKRLYRLEPTGAESLARSVKVFRDMSHGLLPQLEEMLGR